MLDLSDARLEQAVIHYVGNKNNDEGCFISQEALWLEQAENRNAIRKLTTSPFSDGETWKFTHSHELGMNEAYVFCQRLFAQADDIIGISAELARLLYEKSDHPQVKPGEFLTCFFTECHFNHQSVRAIGLYKIEHKDLFLRLRQVGTGYDMQVIEGLALQKPDKACLVLEMNEGEGYTLLLADKQKNHDVQYWKDQFLQAKPASDNFNFTSTVLKLTKDFVTRELPEEFPVSKTESIELLSRSMDYFKSNENFDRKEFAESVFQDDRMIDSFMKYEEDYCKYNELPSAEQFEINNTAVKKQARVYKSVLKLDKNFHIYIHGNRNMIEKGVDETGRKFYKIYFEHEE